MRGRIIAAKDVAFLLINVSPSGNLGPSSGEPVLVFKKQACTALPAGTSDLMEYGNRVATAVRQFYSRATLLATKQAAAQAFLASEFTHQVQHAAASISNHWLFYPHSLRQNEGTPDYDDLVALCTNQPRVLYTELFEAFQSVFKLWTAEKTGTIGVRGRSSDTALGQERYFKLEDLILAAAKFAISEYICIKGGSSRTRVGEFCEFQALLPRVKWVLNFAEIGYS